MGEETSVQTPGGMTPAPESRSMESPSQATDKLVMYERIERDKYTLIRNRGDQYFFKINPPITSELEEELSDIIGGLLFSTASGALFLSFISSSKELDVEQLENFVFRLLRRNMILERLYNYDVNMNRSTLLRGIDSDYRERLLVVYRYRTKEMVKVRIYSYLETEAFKLLFNTFFQAQLVIPLL